MEAERQSNEERMRQMKEKMDKELRLQREENERAEAETNRAREFAVILENTNQRYEEFMAMMMLQHREHMMAMQTSARSSDSCCTM